MEPPSSPSALVAALDVSGLVRTAGGRDLSVTLTARSPATPIAAAGVAGAADALAAFAKGARTIELAGAGAAEAALLTAMAVDLIAPEPRLGLDAGFADSLVLVRLPEARAGAEAALDAMSASGGARDALAASLPAEEAGRLRPSRPLTAATLAVPGALEEAEESFARAILREWGDDLVLALGTGADGPALGPAIDRLRAAAESAGCAFVVRIPADSPATLRGRLSNAAGDGLPVWLHGVPPSGTAAALSRGASLVSPPAPSLVPAAWADLEEEMARRGARRPADLVLLGGGPLDEALHVAAEAIHGPTWFASGAKNGLLALHRIAGAHGGDTGTPLLREALASPPPDCCLYRAEEPDIRDAAGGWLYDRWVRELVRRVFADPDATRVG